VPERYRDRHVGFREEFFAAVKARPMGAGRSLFGRRMDGTEFPVEIALNPLRTDFGLCVLVSVIDITERRAAEKVLLENQQELRLLTGRLLTTQEDERRRIARDLHDDFGQTLALFAVQIDLCRQQAGNNDGLATALNELAQHVKELSSAIHDLSHQLHPFKLEQLGLVVALRALCTECSQNHPLEIEFSHDQIPGSLPRDLALCLFRIAQEAMRNAIKHSQAEMIHVALEGTPEGIRLSVNDNGAGFHSNRIDHPGGLGLISTRERLRLVGGGLTVSSKPGQGTRIEVWVPLPVACHISGDEP
jgi:signal transduction histidine kinase